jgi:hypothetical protein
LRHQPQLQHVQVGLSSNCALGEEERSP